MTDAPLKIWAGEVSGYGHWWRGKDIIGQTPYIREDVALAMVAAQRDDFAAVLQESGLDGEAYKYQCDVCRYDDALDALERVRREARNEALEEAAELCVQMTGTPRYGRNIRAMMEDDHE